MARSELASSGDWGAMGNETRQLASIFEGGANLKANATRISTVAFMVAGGGFEPPTFGLCDLTHLSMRVGLYLHPRGMLAIQSLRLPPPFRGLGSMVSSPRIT